MGTNWTSRPILKISGELYGGGPAAMNLLLAACEQARAYADFHDRFI